MIIWESDNEMMLYLGQLIWWYIIYDDELMMKFNLNKVLDDHYDQMTMLNLNEMPDDEGKREEERECRPEKVLSHL